MDERTPIVVFSHLRWNSVFQRPHHVLSRLAKQRPVYFVEEPVLSEDGLPDSWEFQHAAPGLLVCTPHTPVDAPGFSDAQLPRLAGMTRALLAWNGVREAVAWLYTPMALPLARALRPDVLVYDCMDELSSFLGAPPELREREDELLALADVVFTGGPSLYRAKREKNPAVHCFPSSVDAAHFRTAQHGPESPDTAHLPRPRFGFYGVIDERLDRDLLDGVAAARPDWQIVLVGPVVKIDPASLPRRANLHYLGARRYEELPAHLAGWDVCLLPFARNEATRFISPTKTLEYMAAGRPIVSTPIQDVAEPYGDVVYLGDDLGGFLAGCERALAPPPEERLRREARMREVIAGTSWDATVAAMAEAIAVAAARRRPRVVRSARRTLARAAAAPRSSSL